MNYESFKSDLPASSDHEPTIEQEISVDALHEATKIKAEARNHPFSGHSAEDVQYANLITSIYHRNIIEMIKKRKLAEQADD